MLAVSVAEANGLRSASVASAEADHERRLVSVPICSTREVYKHWLGCKMLLAGANGLRSASDARAKHTMSGGRCSGGVSDCGVEEHRVSVR